MQAGEARFPVLNVSGAAALEKDRFGTAGAQIEAALETLSTKKDSLLEIKSERDGQNQGLIEIKGGQNQDSTAAAASDFGKSSLPTVISDLIEK